jgi:Ca2+/Na+ antiporter
MAFGSLIGITSVSDLASMNEPAGDMAGAAGALMLLICSVAGFIMAMLTVILAKLLHRGEPERITLRFVLSILGGIVISIFGSTNTEMSTILAWFLLLVLPVLLAWFWRTKAI